MILFDKNQRISCIYCELEGLPKFARYLPFMRREEISLTGQGDFLMEMGSLASFEKRDEGDKEALAAVS